MKKTTQFFDFVQKIERLMLIRTVRSGLVMLIPVLMIGAFALIGRSFPIAGYSEFIGSFAGGAISLILNIVYTSTFGMLSVFMALFIGISYSRERGTGQLFSIGEATVSVICFFIMVGVFDADFLISAFGPKGMFTAIVSSYIASAAYELAERKTASLRRLYADGADTKFNNSLAIIIPATVVIVVFAVVNTIIIKLFNVSTFYELFINAFNAIFAHAGRTFGNGLLYVLLSSLLWFCGIHGSDCLEGVAEHLFMSAIDVNIAAAAAGNMPTEILTKQFFDVFVLMGGCGSAFCLLLALLLFGKRRSNVSLSRLSVFPMLFNINETMIFGLPVILNPIMLIPFIATPLFCYFSSYFAMKLGLVPLITFSAEWTTPVLLGGYVATGSLAGSALQLFNIIVGTLIYTPFVRMYDNQKVYQARQNYERLVGILKEHEQSGSDVVLTDMDNVYGDVAKSIAADLMYELDRAAVTLYYQPQYSYDGSCFGCEGLLRVKHEIFGMLYPPLVIKLAEESGFLFELEKKVVRRAIEDVEQLEAKLGVGVKISFNITGDTIVNPDFRDFLCEECEGKDIPAKNLCIEITEQTALKFDDDVLATLSAIKSLGFTLAIDDFSMGQTSLRYLQDCCFDMVKLDGSLSTAILANERCERIIASIASLTETLGLRLLAEFVEDEPQKEALAKAGCFLYQGYLYSKALPIEEL